MSIKAEIRVLDGFEILDIITDQSVHLGNFVPSHEFKGTGQIGVVRFSVYDPSDDDLRGIVAACKGELGRRAAGLADVVTP